MVVEAALRGCRSAAGLEGTGTARLPSLRAAAGSAATSTAPDQCLLNLLGGFANIPYPTTSISQGISLHSRKQVRWFSTGHAQVPSWKTWTGPAMACGHTTHGDMKATHRLLHPVQQLPS